MHDEAVPSATRRIQQYAMRDRRVAWHKAEVCYTGPGLRPTSGAWRSVGRHAAATAPVHHVGRDACTAVLRVALRAQGIGRADGRERGGQYGYTRGGADTLKQK